MVQKDYYELEDSEFRKVKGVKKSASKELSLYNFDMLMIWQISFRSETHNAYTVANIKITVSNGDGKEIQDEDNNILPDQI